MPSARSGGDAAAERVRELRELIRQAGKHLEIVVARNGDDRNLRLDELLDTRLQNGKGLVETVARVHHVTGQDDRIDLQLNGGCHDGLPCLP